jgi:hypothetical protein
LFFVPVRLLVPVLDFDYEDDDEDDADKPKGRRAGGTAIFVRLTPATIPGVGTKSSLN